ncbi:S8 family serine peptidase [Rhodovulum sp. DZ06]|uniref:S8 family serine peptidase n=1 Tax=Rhodovulum sp. DZ06 TaxID=3425126 RepID=UPI003D329FBA
MLTFDSRAADDATAVSAATSAPTEFIVRLAEGAMGTDVVDAALSELRAALGIELTGRTQKFGFQFWRAEEGLSADALAAFQHEWWYGEVVQSVEYIREDAAIHAADLVPSDARFDELWGLDNTGQTGGTADADIDAPEAWDSRTGAGVLVAVIDTGVDYTHSDLDGNMWVNTGEIAGNGRDDDGNGFVDDVYGYDFAYDDGDPMDVQSHGTHVAGTIAAEADGSGVVGVAYNARIMALKFLNDSGSGSTSDAIRAVEYAALMGAQVANNSWGGGGYDQSLADAIELAGQSGLVFVAAAGNDGTNNDSSPHYPSNYTASNVISVASTDHDDQRSSFSNYGATTVDVAAPGSDILSSVPGGGYSSFSGTSMATPHVSGIVALMLEEDPTLTPAQIRERLIATSDPVAALAGVSVSGGRVNAAAALQPPANGTISGVVWEDADGDGIRDAGETALDGVRVFFDSNMNGVHDVLETETWTDADGVYRFEEVTPGLYRVAQDVPPGYVQTAPLLTEAYSVSDSDDAGGPVYDWVEVSWFGTSHALSDDTEFTLALPADFGFEFFGQAQTHVRITDNGLMSFDTAADTFALADYMNAPLGSPDTLRALISPLWDDFVSYSSDPRIYTWHDVANDRVIIQWDDIQRYYNDGSATFQAILEGDGDIVFQYKMVDGNISPTIGIESPDGATAIELAYDTTYARDGLAVRFTPGDGQPTWHEVQVSSGQAVEGVDFGNLATSRPMAEFGRIDALSSTPQTIALSHSFENPVVFLMVNSRKGDSPVTPRLLSVGADAFEVFLQEPNHLDGVHAGESVSWAVMEAGSWRLPDGRLLEVGTTRTDLLTPQGFEDVALATPFDAPPVVVGQVQTFNGADFVQTRVAGTTAAGFQLSMQEEEANNLGIHAEEQVGWFAIEPGAGDWDGLQFEAFSATAPEGGGSVFFDDAFAAAPLLIGGLGSFAGADPAGLRAAFVGRNSASVVIEEDTSADAETGHIAELASLLAVSGSGVVSAAPMQPPVIAGRVWNDLDRDGSGDTAERGLDGWLIYADLDGDGVHDGDEPWTVTDEDGIYQLSGLGAGTWTIRAETPLGWVQTSPSSSGGYTVLSEGGAGFSEAVYNWVDIAGVGTALSHSDDSGVTVSLPFAFDFYGAAQTSVVVSSNGYLTFGTLGSTFSNTALPDAGGPNELIAPFWDDLNPLQGGTVYHWHDAANERFIVQYENVALYNGTGTVTFQAILEADGDIVFQYEDMNGTTSATVGIENASGTGGVQIAYNTPVADGTAWRIANAVGGPLGQEVTLDDEGAVNGIDFGTYSDSNVMAEYGLIDAVGTGELTVTLSNRYVNPVVFVTPMTENGADPAIVRILDTTAGSFTVRVQEANYLDGRHAVEQVSYMVFEAGSWQLEDGTRLEIGEIDTARLTSAGYESVGFDAGFSGRPAVISQVQTDNGADFVQTRTRAVDANGFQVAMQEEEALNDGIHAVETIGYMAIEQGSGLWGGAAYEAFVTGLDFTDVASDLAFASGFTGAPQVLAAIDGVQGPDPAGLRRGAIDADGVSLRVAEDRSFDAEIAHTAEAVSYFAIAGSGALSADPIASTGIDDPVKDADRTALERSLAADAWADAWAEESDAAALQALRDAGEAARDAPLDAATLAAAADPALNPSLLSLWDDALLG